MKNVTFRRIALMTLLPTMLASMFAFTSCRTTRCVRSFELVRNDSPNTLDWNDHRTANLTLIDGKYYTPDGIKSCWCDKCKANARKYKTKYLSHDDVRIVTGYSHSPNPARLVRVEAGENDTRVTFIVEIYHDSNWLHRSAGTCLIDPRTEDMYMIHDIEGGQEVGRMNVVKGLKGRFVEQTMVFPPLRPGVKTVYLYEPYNYANEALPKNGTRFYGDNFIKIKIKDWQPRQKGDVITL